jgi:oligoribonuclease (3'-5' exoribonuclease)
MTPYLSIDIETTGLNPDTCQVLELGCVLNDFSKPLMACRTFEMIINPGHIQGEPRGLAMNARLLEKIADGNGMTHPFAMKSFAQWMRDYVPSRVHPLGKNVAGFDIQFLQRLPEWPAGHIHYRSLEVGTLYANVNGILGQDELGAAVAKRLEIPGEPHEALYDARVSLALARAAWGYHE